MHFDMVLGDVDPELSCLCGMASFYRAIDVSHPMFFLFFPLVVMMEKRVLRFYIGHGRNVFIIFLALVTTHTEME
jgi:hypothetical protein